MMVYLVYLLTIKQIIPTLLGQMLTRQVICGWLTLIAIGLTYLSMRPSHMGSIKLKTWAHSLTSVLFFVYLWQLSVYWYAIHPIHMSKLTPKNTHIIDFQSKLHTYPPLFLAVNFMLTDWTFLRRHAQYAIGAFVIYQAFVYRRNLSHTKEGFFRNFFSYEGLLDSIIFVGFVAALFGVSMLFVKASEIIKGRSIDHPADPIDQELSKRQKTPKGTKKTTPKWTERNANAKKFQ